MNDLLVKHVIDLDLTNIIQDYGNKPNVIFKVFNKAVATLKDVHFEVKPLFKGAGDPDVKLIYAFKILPNDPTSKNIVKNGNIEGTFRGRHTLEIDILLSSEDLMKSLFGLELIIKRNEQDYFGYPDQKYIFKIEEEAESK